MNKSVPNTLGAMRNRWLGRLDASMIRRLKYRVIGKELDKGLLFKAFIYLLLIDTAFIYLSPLIYMITTTIKDAGDLLDPAVEWVPRAFYVGTLQEAWHMLDYTRGLTISAVLSLLSAVLQTLSCAVAGYAFARLEFPFKKIWLFFLVLTFIVPPQITILPSLLAAREFNMIDSYMPIILPTLFGHGLKGALFVIIFRQFFNNQPKELEEAARMDGAGALKVFLRVMLPLAMPAITVVFLFSFVWNWNDAYYPSMYLNSPESYPLSMGVSVISATLEAQAAEFGETLFTEPIKMATSLLIILPQIVLYMFTQRYFTEGVERTGLVE